MNEKELVCRAIKHESHALSELLQRNYVFLLKYLIKVTLHRPTAEDLAQETMMRVAEKISLYNPEQSKFSTWLITIATRVYVDFTRRQKRESDLLEEESKTGNIKWNTGISDLDKLSLIESLARIPEATRTLIVLKHYYGYDYHEIATMFNVPEGTVKSRVHYGLKMLRKEMNADEVR
jgi:RNA polymerase sigma-70 factor, ECF subfamily